MILDCHLVIGMNQGGKLVARRVSRKKGYLEEGEAVIHLQLDVPDDAFDAPLYTLEVEKQHLQVGVKALEVEE